MINLLPPQEKKTLMAERKRKLSVIFSFMVFFFIFVLVFTLFSLNIYLSKRAEYYANIASRDSGFEQEEEREIKEKVKEANKILLELKEHYNQETDYATLLLRIGDILPQNVYLHNFSAVLSEAKEDSHLKISLSGLASSREDLFDLKKRLEQENNFKEVSFPPANWVQASDIDFSVSFKISK